MTRSELVATLALRFPDLGPGDAAAAVDVILEAMRAALVTGQRIEIRGFGSFSVRTRAARVARNPRTGDLVQVSAKRVPYFRAGKALRVDEDG